VLGDIVQWSDVINHVVIPDMVILLIQEDLAIVRGVEVSYEDALAVFYRSRAFGLHAYSDLKEPEVHEGLVAAAEALDAME
jgi:hypothetical protein